MVGSGGGASGCGALVAGYTVGCVLVAAVVWRGRAGHLRWNGGMSMWCGWVCGRLGRGFEVVVTKRMQRLERRGTTGGQVGCMCMCV